MVRKSRWENCGLKKGVAEIKLSSWKYFSDYINQEMLGKVRISGEILLG